jgi:hypothetical protein
MNPPRKTTGLFLTPRGPYGRRLPERARKHMHGAEDAPQGLRMNIESIERFAKEGTAAGAKQSLAFDGYLGGF